MEPHNSFINIKNLLDKFSQYLRQINLVVSIVYAQSICAFQYYAITHARGMSLQAKLHKYFVF